MKIPKTENWAWIPDFEGEYEASNLGRIRSHKRKIPRILAQTDSGNGYRVVSLKSGRNFLVHRLVLSAHKRRPHSIEIANHLNGVKNDNRLENLVWCTPRENVEHAFKLGLVHVARGENQGHAKLTNEQVKEIKGILKNRIFRKPPLLKDIAKQFGVDKNVILKISCGYNWGHI